MISECYKYMLLLSTLTIHTYYPDLPVFLRISYGSVVCCVGECKCWIPALPDDWHAAAGSRLCHRPPLTGRYVRWLVVIIFSSSVVQVQ